VKTVYKGFEIEVYRGKCMAGYPLVYYSIFRISDGWELDSGFYDTADTVSEIIKDMKAMVDHYLKNPSDYGED
jgi:hypothetical protein